MKSLIILMVPWLAYAQEGDNPLTKLPKPKVEVEAAYPESALRQRIEATVAMELDISATGKVEAVTVVSTTTVAEAGGTSTSTPAPVRAAFIQSATTAVAKMEFEPAETKDGPVPVRIAFTYHFKLPPPPPPPPPTSEPDTPQEPEPQVVNFSGLVRERGTRAKIPGVVVTVFQGESGVEAVTDKTGKFQFFNLAPGEWKVLAEADGYYPFRTAEMIRADEAIDVTYYLEKGSYNPYDVVIEAKRPKKEVNRRTLKIAEIVKVPGTLGDPILVVENLPGVARPAPGSGQIVVRGAGPQNTGIFLDSVEVPLIFHFGGLRSVVPADTIESVDFYPGNFPVFYGRKTGGIFNANIKRLNPDQVHGSVDVSLLDAGLYLEAPLTDGLAVAISGRRSYVDAILNAVVPDDADVSLTSAPRYYDYQVLAEWRPTREHSIRGVFLGSDDEIKLLFENPADLDTQLTGGDLQARTHFDRFYATWDYTPSKTVSNEFRFAFGRDDVSASFFTEFEFQFQILQFQLRDHFRWQLDDSLTLNIGFDGLYPIFDVFVRAPPPFKEGDVGFQQDLDDVITTDRKGIDIPSAGIYVDAEYQVAEGLLLVPGVRGDYFHAVKQFTGDPRLVVRYSFLEDWTVKGGVGLVHQAPEPDELDPEFGNPDLGIERAIQYSVGGEWTPTDHINVDLTFFYNDLRDQVSRTGALKDDGRPMIYDNNGKGRTYGMELFLRHEFKNNFRGWLSYTLSRSERTESGETQARLFSFDQTHILNVNLSYVFPANWEIGARFRLVSGNPTTPFTKGVYLSDFDRYAPVAGEANSDRLPLFHQLDLRVEKRWVFDWWSISAYLSLLNTYNNQNVEALQYNFDFTKTQNVTGLPVLPILGIRGEF